MKFPGKNLQDLLPKPDIQKSIPSLPRPYSMTKTEVVEENMPGAKKNIRLDDAVRANGLATGDGFCVALIDTGVSRHIDIEKAMLERISCNRDPLDIYDAHGHGTHIAGLIAGRGRNVAGKGVAPGAMVLSIKVTNQGNGDVSWLNIIRGMKEIINRVNSWDGHPDKPMISVVNLSINSNDNLLKSDKINKHVLIECIETLYAKNVPVVVSSGNNYERFKRYGLAYPAYHEKVISVGAVCDYDFEGYVEDSIAPFSQRIPHGIKDAPCFVLAPGVLSISLSNTDVSGYTYMTGSSIAAPVVTGIILLMQQLAIKGKEKNYANLPAVSDLQKCLTNGSVTVINSAAENSPFGNAKNLYYDSLRYNRVDAVNCLEELKILLNNPEPK